MLSEECIHTIACN